MKIGNINVRVTRFFGNLYAVTLPTEVSDDKAAKLENLRVFLANMCDGNIDGFIDPLSPSEKSMLPETGTTFVLTNDSYMHILPTYKENVRYSLVCT